jgi:protein-S-isoprenylcysteine O-methyltransferase Ste14
MNPEVLQLRRAVVCGSGLLYWAGVAIQARRVRKLIGHSPNVRPRGARERILWFGWFLIILVWIGQPLVLGSSTTTPGVSLITILLHPLSLVIGLAMVAIGYAGTLWTYATMGGNWRMGVDPKESTALVCDGPFRWVRHPIYMLQMVMLIGAALLLPTFISFATLVIHYLCVRLKARDEERYLESVHGRAYREYSAHTGGLLPKLLGRRVAANNDPSNGRLIYNHDRATSSEKTP